MSYTYTLAPAAGAEFNYIIPACAPFDASISTLTTVSIVATAKSWCGVPLGVSTPLVQWLDWVPSLRFAGASAELGRGIYFAISFMDTALAGVVTVNGVSVDISFTPTNAQIAAFATGGVNPLVTTWESFFNITTPYPQAVIGYGTTTSVDIVSQLNTLNTMLASSSGKTSVFNFNIHISNYNNPHITTSKDLGLDAVPNWITGMAADMVNKNANAFVTPAGVASGILTVIPQATPTIPGSFKLNLGTSAGDDLNTVKALTASGLVSLITNVSPNAINAYFNKPRRAVRFSPFPITYPAKWNGTNYVRFADLVAAVEAYTHMPNLMNSDILGTIWFPNSVTPPSLVLG